MFSRIQTFFLLLVAVAMFTLLLFPIWTKKTANNQTSVTLNAFTLTYKKEKEPVQTTYTFYIAISAITAGALALYAVLRYRNQMKDTKVALYNQIRFSMIISLLIMATAIMIILFKLQSDKYAAGASEGSFGIGFFCIPLALLSNFLASRFIRKDYNIIKSMDRLR